MLIVNRIKSPIYQKLQGAKLQAARAALSDLRQHSNSFAIGINGCGIEQGYLPMDHVEHLRAAYKLLGNALDRIEDATT